MKKLGCLLIILSIIAGLFYTGTVTIDKLLFFSEDALVWSIGALSSLLEKVQAVNASSVSKEDILLVNADHPLPDGYSPGTLVNLFEQKRHFLLARDDLLLTTETFEAANRMFEDAEKQGLNGFIITSAYRTREDQQRIYQESEPGYAQKPGCSEHETGLAFDVTARSDDGNFEKTKQCQWLLKNCWKYGFIQRYPEGKEKLTGVEYEPWHYRYVGTETAQKIHAFSLTLEEYLAR